MMTSSNGNIFRITGPLWGEFTGHQWIPLTKASDAELWCFLWSAPEHGSANNQHGAYYNIAVMRFRIDEGKSHNLEKVFRQLYADAWSHGDEIPPTSVRSQYSERYVELHEAVKMCTFLALNNCLCWADEWVFWVACFPVEFDWHVSYLAESKHEQ